MLFNTFISSIMHQRKFNLKVTMTNYGKYFTTIGQFTFEEIDDNHVLVTSSNYKYIFTNIGFLLNFVEGIRV